MSDPAPEVSVVVVNWNAGAALAGALDSVKGQSMFPALEAVVVDNASSDGSLEAAGAAQPWARVIRNPDNRGLAAANNQGLAATSAPYVLIANPDVVLPAGAVEGLLAAMQRHPRAAFIVPRLAGPDGAPQTSAGDLPRLGEALLGRRVAFRPARPGATSGFWWHGWSHDEERRIGRGAEACYLVRRAAVADFGPQDERYRLDWEGIDWTERAHRAGWEVWLEPSVTVIHLGGVSISQAGLRWVVESHRGMYRYFAERGGPGYPGRGGRGGRPGRRALLAGAIAGRAVLKAAAVGIGLPLYRRAHGGPRA